MRDLWLDVRYGARMLAKAPGMTALAVLTLALGIAVNACVFSYVNTLLLRPATGVPSPQTLVDAWGEHKNVAGAQRFTPLAYPDYLYYRDHAKTLSGFIAFDGDPEGVIWNRDGNGQVVLSQLVSGNFFSVLGVGAEMGRTISPADDTAGADQVVVVSDRFWKGRLAADANVVGKRIVLNGVEYRIVGVAPPGFEGLEIALEPDFWVPIAASDKITRDADRLTNWNTYWLFGVGRLKPGNSIAEARAEMNVLADQLVREHPVDRKDMGMALFRATMLPGPFRGYVAAFTGLLMVVVGLVLAIACTNAANLMLARAIRRRREMAIRSAMGASRGRLMRQAFVESMLLAAMAGSAAILLAYWTAPLLMRLKPAILPIRIEVPMDWRVIGFTVVISMAAGILFGLAPALRGSRADLAPALRSESSGGGYEKSRLRAALVIGQMAACAVLLVGAVLCVRSLANAQSIDPGFDTKHVAMAMIDAGSVGYNEAQRSAFYEKLLARVEELPGVTSASWTSSLPLGTERRQGEISIEGKAGKKKMGIDMLDVRTKYFETMGIPFLRGRDFTPEESKSHAKVAVINEAMARLWWPEGEALGAHVQLSDEGDFEIIGIVKTGKYRTLGEDPLPVIYTPIGSEPRQTLVVRTANDPRSLLEPIRREIAATDPNLVATDLETLDQFMTFPLFPARVTGILLGVFGVLALVLALGGLYGVISYTMSQRTREIGLRMALGAQERDVAKLVLKYGLALAGTGVAIGIAAAFGVTRVLSSLLYGIRADDPATLVTVSVVLVGVTLLACYLPARRAMRIDPMVALRYE
ncbi:MAG TPA: ABC transporter permease [Candidatus Limnocylindrales bacterium]|nr:ABC transporter permease [Candidatus Limnocylindrales bacterium]